MTRSRNPNSNVRLHRGQALGQHFLVDAAVRDLIVQAANLSKEHLVVEIGPGKGALTRALGDKAGRVIAIEVDRHLASELGRHLADLNNVDIVAANALEVDLWSLVHDAIRPGGQSHVVVVANLPYYITTPLLKLLLDASPLFREMVVMVQLEVAKKLTARPSTDGYGVLSLEAQYRTVPEILFVVAKEAFSPQPRVQSAVVRLTVRDKAPVSVDEKLLMAVVRAGFAHRRKSIRNAILGSQLIRGDTSLLERALAVSGVDGNRRAQTISMEEFAAMAQAITGGAVHE